MSSRPPHQQQSRGREYDGPGNYGRGGNNYDNIRGGGGDTYRGGNYDRSSGPPPSYMNDRGGNYGPAMHHGYDSGPYRNAPAGGGNYGGPRGGYDNYDGPRGGNRPPIRSELLSQVTNMHIY